MKSSKKIEAQLSCGNEEKPDWMKIQAWLQSVVLEIDYLVWRVIAAQCGGKMPEGAPRIFALNDDMEDEPLTERLILARLKEICRLANGWRTSETFPQF